jgi:hypothetical protein
MSYVVHNASWESHIHSLEFPRKVNYIRMCVEQQIAGIEGKSFLLLLHYSPSSTVQARCYPALFLGGWEHVFLDSVGNDGSSIDVNRFISVACHEPDSLSKCENDAHESVQMLAQRMLPHLVKQNLFYREQLSKLASFNLRRNRLDQVLNTKVGGSSIVDILCEKFTSWWFDKSLHSTTKRAAQALLAGTTQLSLSMSVHSALVQLFQSFLSEILIQTNQWKNFDLVDDMVPDVGDLFGLILRSFPVRPYEELSLQRNQSTLTRLSSLPCDETSTIKPLFPFFHFVSTYLDHVVDSAAKAITSMFTSNEYHAMSAESCFQASVTLLQDSLASECGVVTLSKVQESKVVGDVISVVARESTRPANGLSLFDRYLRQFVEWKVGCLANAGLLEWLAGFTTDCGDGSAANILAIHVIFRLKQMDLIKAASIGSLFSSYPLIPFEGSSTACYSNLSSALLDSVDCAASGSKFPWPALLYVVGDAVVSTGESSESKSMANRLRRLGFIYAGDETALGIRRETVESCNDGILSLRRLLYDRSTTLLLALFYRFLSPLWLRTTQFFWLDDVGVLAEAIADGLVEDRHVAVGLLRGACAFENEPLLSGNRSVSALLLLNGQLQSPNLSKFCGRGKRVCIPHFFPQWLRRDTHVDKRIRMEHLPNDARQLLPSYVQDYEHGFGGLLSEAVFELLLSAFVTEAETLTSEQMYVMLTSEMESELSLDQTAYAQLARLRAMDAADSLRGTAIAAIAISARCLCFVAKIATEIAAGVANTVLSGAYSRDALLLLELVMAQPDVLWAEFFMCTIIRLRGEGTLSEALDGPLAGLSWCQAWKDGLPTARENSVAALRQAETLLAETMAEEERKASEFRHCPHCRQLFIVGQLNCGRFRCGEDFHRVDGRPNLSGGLIANVRGCGQEFTLDSAPRYVIDSSAIDPLRAEIQDKRSKLDRCHQSAVHWEAARSISIPIVTIHAKNQRNSCDSLFVEMQFLSSVRLSESAEMSNVFELVRNLLDATKLSHRLSVLPDLIEVSFMPCFFADEADIAHTRF